MASLFTHEPSKADMREAEGEGWGSLAEFLSSPSNKDQGSKLALQNQGRVSPG